MFDELAFENAVEKAHAIQAETGFLPALDDPRLEPRQFVFWTDFDWDDPLDELIERQRVDQPGTRAAVGSGLYSLLRVNLDGERFDTILDAFRRYLGSIAVSEICDERQLRWELHAAGTGAALDRAIELATRAENLRPTADLLFLIASTIFHVIHPTRSVPLSPSDLDPLIHEPSFDPARYIDFKTYLLATVVQQNPKMPWTDPSGFDAEALDALIRVDALLQRINVSQKSLSPTQQAIQAWCWFALGSAMNDANKLIAAADRYSSLPSYEIASKAADFKSDSLTCRAAAHCYGQAGRWGTAVDAARRWVEAAPNDPQAHRFLAQALAKDERVGEAIESFERYMKLRADDEGDWEANLLLRLGLDVQRYKNLHLAIETTALNTPFRAQGESVTAWFCPWFDTLSPLARERWWTGIYSVSSPHIAKDLGDARWDQAADCFGEAVAFELKARIFVPFSEAFKEPTQDEHWTKVLTNRGALGQLLQCLLQSRTPHVRPAKALAVWLPVHVPKFSSFVKSMRREGIKPLWTLRGSAQHDRVNEMEARQVYDLASRVLRALTSDPRITP